MLVNVDDVKLLFKWHHIKCNLTDKELERLIQLELDSLLAQLGVSLEPQSHNFTKHNHPSKKPLVLPLDDIVGVDRVVVNGDRLCSHEYFFDELNGIVYITRDYGCCSFSYVHVNYITKLPNIFLEKLKSLLLDTILLIFAPTINEENIKSIKEGDVTVTYDFGGWQRQIAARIPVELEELKDMLNHDRVYMIG